MPLSFNALTHGPVAFGFFNIDTDMLLLQEYFFFADIFCARITDLAGQTDAPYSRELSPVYRMDPPDAAGDLMGAIHGVHFSGFIGDVYHRFPFPVNPAGFKQQPEGFETRNIIETLIQPYAGPAGIPFRCEADETVLIGRYRFEKAVFHQLIAYVWQGGYPRWRDGIRPAYVSAMKAAVTASAHPLLNGMRLP